MGEAEKKVGRPTKYTEKTCEQVRDYINNHTDYEDLIPSIAGLAVALGVSRETIYEWSKDESKANFSYMLGELLAKQERVLLSKGLSSEFNPTITKLVLAKHSYHDKQDTTVANPDGTPLKITTVELVAPTNGDGKD